MDDARARLSRSGRPLPVARATRQGLRRSCPLDPISQFINMLSGAFNRVSLSGLLLGNAGAVTGWFEWGVEARAEFAIVTLVLAALLFAKEIVTTTEHGSERISRALTIVILPLLALFIINLVFVFLL